MATVSAMDVSRQQIMAARWLLRIGLAAVLLYAAVGAALAPDRWVGYLPTAATQAVGAGLALKLFALYQLALAVWLITGRWGRYAAGLMGLTMVGVIGANLQALDVTFRDTAILLAAAALAVLS